MSVGKMSGTLRNGYRSHPRWNSPDRKGGELVQIAEQAEEKAS
jgi:hypothetical protein